MKTVDIGIIGQGLAGTLLAFELLEQGIDFRIISSPQKSKASLVAAGMVNPLVFKRLTKSWMVDDLLPQMTATYNSLEEKLENKFYFEKDILKPLAAQETELWHKRIQEHNFSDYIAEITPDSPLEELLPMFAYGRVRNAGYLNLSLFLKEAERFFLEKNLLLQSELDFSKFNPGLNVVQIDSNQFQKVVFCEGAHLRKNPFFRHIKLNPVKGEVLLIHSKELSEKFILNKKVFVLPVGNQCFKVGSTYEWKDLREETTENGKLSIIERFENLVAVNYTIENQWAGIRPTVIDRRPILGIHHKYKNLSVFNGLGTKGVMLAPYFAKEMLKILTVENYKVSEEVQLERFL